MEITNLKLGIGIPHNTYYAPFAFFDSFIAMEKIPFIYLRSSAGNNIAGMRNNIVKAALKNACSHLIMMDTDQIYPHETITRLLEHRLPIVGCKIHRRYPPFDPLMFSGEPHKYLNIDDDDYEPGALVKVDATGTGCVLFDMRVFQDIPAPWFAEEINPETGEVETGEDFYFCQKAREHGFDIYVDTSLNVGHLSQMIVNEGTHKLYKRVKKQELENMHEIHHRVVVNK